MRLFGRHDEHDARADNGCDVTPAPWVPKSVRPAADLERRESILLPTDDDEDDDEVQFLASLVDQIEREDGQAPAVPPVPDPPAIQRYEPDDADRLWLFHQRAPEPDELEGVRQHLRGEVDLEDLLDDLSTTAAALRRLKAA
jgi:hypothetical protein